MIIVCIWVSQTSKIYKISRLKISYANCFCPNLEIWVKKITLTCLPSADWCCREPIMAGPNKGDKKVDPGTTPWVCPCLWSKAWSDSKSRRDKWVLTPYMYMYIDTLMYGHPASRLAFHLLDFGKTVWESSIKDLCWAWAACRWGTVSKPRPNNHAPHTVAAFKTIVLSTNECLHSNIQIHS